MPAKLILVAALTVVAGAAAAQTDAPPPSGTPPRPVARGTTVGVGPRVDGRLDDAAWAQAEPLTGFVQRDPREGAPATERTEVRIVSDGEALYVGAWLWDRDPGGIVPGERLRDAELTNSDYFGIILDTYLDRQNGFVFSTTPSGIEYDGQVVKEGEGGGVIQTGQRRVQSGAMGGFNLNWDGSWTVATSRDSAGWYAEFRIPFSTLRYGGGRNQQWGLNLVRGIRRRNEEAFWSPIPRQFGLMRLSLAGTLQGIDVPVRRAATITPYLLGAVRRDFRPGEATEWPREAGADAKLGLTPSLTLDLTYNTDFAQVEVDEQRTNLTRFPLFFPEKRPFFLENAGIFSAGTPQAADLFFTRRIGISETGEPVPILGGARLTGRTGGLTIGLLQIFTDDVPEQTGNSYSVARLTREIGSRSRIGLIGVGRISTEDMDDHNVTYGVDGRIGLGPAWTVDWWGAATETPGLGRGGAFSVRAGLQTGRWMNSLRYLQVGRDFNPEVGFLSRKGYRHIESSIFRIIRTPGIPWMRQFNPHVTYRGHWGLDGAHQSTYLHVDPEFDFEGGGRLGPELNIQGETLTEPFEIADGVVLQPGRYTWAFNGWDFSTNPSAPVSVTTRLDLGGFYTGTRFGGNTTLTVRSGASFAGSLQADHNIVRLDEGDFTRTVLGVRLGYFFTPRIFFQSLMQYSNQARVVTANARFGWLNTAGTGLFVVFNEAQEADGLADWVRPQARSLTIKFTRQLGTGS